MGVEIYHWVIFNVAILTLLIIDLWRSYRNPHPIQLREAIWTSVGWISLALMFNVWIYFRFGLDPALKFLAGYLLEKSLSVDNLFIFLLIFSHFGVPDSSKHIVLFYGILGAILMRAALIWGGIELIGAYSWFMEVFGVFLIYMGLKLFFTKEKKIDIEKNLIYSLLRKWIKITPEYLGQKFFAFKDNQWYATPLLAVIILIESIDLLFALDSVPAVIGITTEPFLVYTSNICAILGLRSLFFVLESLMKGFYLLHYAVSIILVLIGCKIIAENFIHIPIAVTLGTIVTILGCSLIGSQLFPLPADEQEK